MENISLSKLIFRQYARSALLIILTIEVLLLLAYFASNWFLISSTKSILERQARDMLAEVAEKTAKVFTDGVLLIESRAELFARAHEVFFAAPDSVAIEGEKPIFARAPNGTWYQSNITDGSSLFVAKTGEWGEKERLFATNTVALNPLYKRIVETTPGVVAAYINTPGDMNRLYPFIPDAWKQYPQDLHMQDYNFYFLADERHNPARVPVWTEIYNDPAGNGIMMSCVAPVYVGNVLQGVVGLDLNTETFAQAFGRDASEAESGRENSWAPSVFLVSRQPDGEKNLHTIVFAPPKELEHLFGWREDLEENTREKVTPDQHGLDESQIGKRALSKVRDAGLRGSIEQFIANPSVSLLPDVETADGNYFLAGKEISGIVGRENAEYWVFALKKKSGVLQPAEKLERQARNGGILILGLMVLFYLWFFRFLRRRAQRMAAMITAPMQSKLQAKETELAYTRGLYESASGYLHNVGNAITRMESSLLDLNKVIKSSEQYPEAFHRIKAGGAAGAETLRKFEEVLVGRTVPALKSVADSITRIKDAIRNAIAHQQAGFKAAVRQASEEVNLSELLDDMCRLFRNEHPALSADLAPGVCVRGHRDPLVQGLDNIIRNAIQASPPGGRISVTCQAARDGALVTVSDEGRGISAGDLPKVMRAGFTTKEGGHGLGLHSFAVFLSASGGLLRVESPGLGKGATVSIDIRNV